MRLCSYIVDGWITSGVIIEDRVLSLSALAQAVGVAIPVDLESVIRAGVLPIVREAVSRLTSDLAVGGRP